MKRLQDKAAAIGRAAQRRKIDGIERAATDLGIRAESGADRVTLSGPGLVKRWLSDTSLRFITGLMR